MTHWFPLDPGHGLNYGISSALQEAGDVRVIAGSPIDLRTNEVTGPYPWWRPYRRLVDPFPVQRVPTYPGHTASSWRRLAMYGSFAASASVSGWRSLASADLNVVYASPATAAVPALVASRLHSTPFILIVQDVWPDSVSASGFLDQGLGRRLVHSQLNSFIEELYGRAAHVIVISEQMRHLLMERGVPEDKLSVVYNWADEAIYSEAVDFERRCPRDPLHVMYAGNLGAAQGLISVLRAMALLPRDRVRLTVIGGGTHASQLKAQAEGLGLANVQFRPAVEPQTLPGRLAKAQLHLVSLVDDPLFAVTVPSKLQSLLASGAPILACAPGAVADLVFASGAGIVSRPGDPEDLARVLREATDLDSGWFVRAGQRARDFYLSNMSESAGKRGYRDVAARVLAAG